MRYKKGEILQYKDRLNENNPHLHYLPILVLENVNDEDENCEPLYCSAGKNLKLVDLPKSEVLVKRIFTKGEGEKLMIQKYVVWKTNKEESSAYPAYVFFYTDFSCGRKDMLKRDLRVSSDKDQAIAFMEQAIVENVKKGWEEVK